MTQPKKRVRPRSRVVLHDIRLTREQSPDGRNKVVASAECERHQSRFDVDVCRSCERFARIEMHEGGFVVLCRSEDEDFDVDE
jgi:hypothetical protein